MTKRQSSATLVQDGLPSTSYVSNNSRAIGLVVSEYERSSGCGSTQFTSAASHPQCISAISQPPVPAKSNPPAAAAATRLARHSVLASIAVILRILLSAVEAAPLTHWQQMLRGLISAGRSRTHRGFVRHRCTVAGKKPKPLSRPSAKEQVTLEELQRQLKELHQLIEKNQVDIQKTSKRYGKCQQQRSVNFGLRSTMSGAFNSGAPIIKSDPFSTDGLF